MEQNRTISTCARIWFASAIRADFDGRQFLLGFHFSHSGSQDSLIRKPYAFKEIF